MSEAPSVWEGIGQAPDSLAEWATEALRQIIIMGELPPGAPIVIKDLSERLGISVTPLREALQRLTAYGLVEQRSRRAFVAPVSHRELEDIYELRKLLEPQAVERSVAHADGIWLRQLDHAYGTMVGAAESGSIAFEVAHREFHRTLIRCCPSPYLRRFVGSLLDASSRYRMLAIAHSDYSSQAHDQLYEASRRQNSSRAGQLILEHVVTLTHSQLERLQSLGLLT
jgi:GntR family carbon starvation induced transcriptional regulator